MLKRKINSKRHFGDEIWTKENAKESADTCR